MQGNRHADHGQSRLRVLRPASPGAANAQSCAPSGRIEGQSAAASQTRALRWAGRAAAPARRGGSPTGSASGCARRSARNAGTRRGCRAGPTPPQGPPGRAPAARRWLADPDRSTERRASPWRACARPDSRADNRERTRVRRAASPQSRPRACRVPSGRGRNPHARVSPAAPGRAATESVAEYPNPSRLDLGCEDPH